MASDMPSAPALEPSVLEPSVLDSELDSELDEPSEEELSFHQVATEAELAELDALYDEANSPEVAEQFARITPEDWYKQGLVALLDGVLFPCLRHRGRLRARVTRVQATRYLRALDQLALLYPIGEAKRTPEHLDYLAERARIQLMRRHPQLRQVLLRAVQEIVLQEAPSLEGEGRPGWLDGLKGPELDPVLSVMGLKLGSKNRASALKQLRENGWVVQNTAHRWSNRFVESQQQAVAADHAYQRFCFLSMLDKTVVQRFMGVEGALWFMGFNEAPDRRRNMLEQLAQTSRTWLEAHAVRLATIAPGQESELVWVQTGMMVAARPPERIVLPEWLVEEVELTVMAGVQARLGLGSNGNDFFRRALADREQRYEQACQAAQREREKILGLSATKTRRMLSLSISAPTRTVWRGLASFETPKHDDLFRRGNVHSVMIQTLAHLREVYPEARTPYQVYEYAQAHWPAEYAIVRLIEWACRRLEAFHLVAQCSVREGFNRSGKPRWKRGFKALALLRKPDEATGSPNRLAKHLEDLLDCMGAEAEEERPCYRTSRWILRRSDVSTYLQQMRTTREQMCSAIHAEEEMPVPGISPLLLCMQVSIDPITVIVSSKA